MTLKSQPLFLFYALLTMLCLNSLGMEIAACLADKAKSVTSLDIVDVPFKLILGKTVGLALKKVCNN